MIKKENPVKKILSKLKYRHLFGRSEGLELICYTNRGSPGDFTQATVRGITVIKKGHFVLGDGETQIPYHRVRAITSWDGKVLYERKRVS